jgi:type II secretory pathway component PulJ
VLERLRQLRSERGATLVEMAITMLLLGVVMAVFGAMVVSIQTAAGRQQARVDRNDEAELALAQLDREIRSGNVLYDPMAEIDPSGDIVPGMSMRIYTQADAPNRNPGNQCAQWRITNGTLQTRRWAITDPDGTVTDWWTVASDIVNRTTSPQVSAFALEANNQYLRVMNITLVVDRTDDKADPQTFKMSIAGRNTQNGFPEDVCDDVPAY